MKRLDKFRKSGELMIVTVELFQFLLSPEHAPMSFDLSDTIIGFNLTIHMSDVFSPREHEELSTWLSRFLTLADQYDNLLIDKYGCEPAPNTRLAVLNADMTEAHP